LPLWYLGRRPGTLRRVLWCWLIPLAPIMFCWDGIVSILRYWTDETWIEQLEEITGPTRPISVENSLFSSMIAW
jgi:hypothetical protein